MTSELLTAHWCYVLALVLLTCGLSIKLGQWVDAVDIEMYDFLEHHGLEDSKRKLLGYSTRKRIAKLIEYALGLVLAWAVRDAMKLTITSFYDDNLSETELTTSSDSVTALWTYTIIATILVTFSNTVNERYYILYPRKQYMSLQFETDERKMIGEVLYKNAQTVVGIAWYDAIVESPEQIEVEFREKHRIWLLWVLSLSIMIFSGIATGFWERQKLRFQTKVKGPVAAFFGAFEHWFDPSRVLERGKKSMRDMLDGDDDDDSEDDSSEENSNSKDEVATEREESFMYEYFTQWVDLMLYALNFASGWLVSAAVKAVLIKTYSGVYDPDEVEEVSDDVIWSVWVAFVIALIVSVVVMTYLSKVVQKLRVWRHELFEGWRQEMEMEKERNAEEKEEVETGAGRTSNITDDPQQQDEEENGKAETEIEME